MFGVPTVTSAGMRVACPALCFALFAACAAAPKAAPPDAATPLPPATSQPALDGCSGEVDNDTHTLTCPSFVVSRTVIAWDETWTEDLILNTTLATLREGAETVGTTSDREVAASLSVEGGRGYAMKISTATSEGTRVFGMTTYARPFDPQHVVGVICMDLEQTTTQRCEELSVWFAGELPAVAWTDVSRPMAFAGRLLAAPAGCEADGDRTITCANGAELLWFERAADGDDGFLGELDVVRRTIVRVNEERTAQKPTPTTRDFACALDGAPAQCSLSTYDFAGTDLHVLVGTGTVRGIDVGVLCDWTDAAGPPIPAPCSLLVAASADGSTTEL